MSFVPPEGLRTAYDLVVVGGGITGVSVAREGAARGLSTLVLDKTDFGAGTSSATTKYIHGGVRYLERLEIGVVRESLRERRILALAAPHLVEQRRFLMPAWGWSRPGAALLGAGMGLYDALSYDRNREATPALRIPHPGWLSRARLLEAVPWLDPQALRGAWTYTETLNVFPERLLLALLESAIADGADAANHARVVGVGPGGDGGLAVVVRDELTGSTTRVRAGAVVNAAGPWADEVFAGRMLSRVRLLRSKGVHAITRQIPGGEIRDSMWARGRSGRHVVVSPWQGRLMIGPTDTPLSASADEATVEDADVDTVLEVFNETLAPGVARLTREDVEWTTVGVRPLLAGRGTDTTKASRGHVILDHADDGLPHAYTIVGGKWTTGRATGEAVVEQLLARNPDLARNASAGRPTRRRAVSQAFGWAEDPEPFLAEARARWADLGLDPAILDHVLRLHGADATRVLELVAADPALGRRISSRDGVLDIAAQAVVAVRLEGARTLEDVILRRLTIGGLGPVSPGERAQLTELTGLA